MTTVVRRYPTFEIQMVTEKSEYILKYDTKKQLTQKDLEEAILSFSVKNDMADDSPVFSMILLGREQWEASIGSNDLIRIKVIPDTETGEPRNPYIMVGLISEVHKEGDYGDGLLMYRVTGRAMSKALIDFEVGVIQEVSVVITDFGWLPDDEETGLSFSTKSASEIGEQLMDRFVYEYIKYDFSNGKGLKDYFTHNFSSWEEYESLADVTPFINYEGSMRQFLEDVASKPFNELFFEFTEDGKCVVMMRPTPFDPENWGALPTYGVHSDAVLEESFGKSDAEMSSVFVVHAPNLPEFSSVDLGVFPQHHPDLLKKYGYKRLDAENRYLLTSGLEGALEDSEEAVNPEIGTYPSYDTIAEYVLEKGLEDGEALRTKRGQIVSSVLEDFPIFSGTEAEMLVDAIADGDFSRERYRRVVDSTGDAEVDAKINEEKDASKEKLELFTKKLFNWYADNANFYGGDIRVIGNPQYRIGSRIIYKDKERDTVWEFYLESTQHEFSYTNGYTTILGVTRGLPHSGRDRFSNLWGKSEDFKGGYFGELSLEELKEKATIARNQDGMVEGGISGGWGAIAGSGVAVAALNTGLEMANKNSVYVFGGGRTGQNPFQSSPIKVDCSAFVWWCYYVNGVTLNGGKTGMTTDTIKVDKQLRTVSPIRGDKKSAMSKLRVGDIVYFDTYKIDGHLGIYKGNGKFVGSQSNTGIAVADMSSGYWWDKFNGRVLRYGN